MKRTVGILGGMGPMATADFLQKLISQTKAECDQEHIPLIVYSIPQIPDRSSAIVASGESPFPMLLEGARTLQDAGATCIAIPCNTAHYWHRALSEELSIPVLHIAECVCEYIGETVPHGANIGILATEGTLRADFYRGKLDQHGFSLLAPSEEEQATLVNRGIELVKRGAIDRGGELLDVALRKLLERGASKVILGCTEIPIGLSAVATKFGDHALDATLALAQSCIRWSIAAPENDEAQTCTAQCVDNKPRSFS